MTGIDGSGINAPKAEGDNKNDEVNNAIKGQIDSIRV
jgi:hypothetical protein